MKMNLEELWMKMDKELVYIFSPQTYFPQG